MAFILHVITKFFHCVFILFFYFIIFQYKAPLCCFTLFFSFSLPWHFILGHSIKKTKHKQVEKKAPYQNSDTYKNWKTLALKLNTLLIKESILFALQLLFLHFMRRVMNHNKPHPVLSRLITKYHFN